MFAGFNYTWPYAMQKRQIHYVHANLVPRDNFLPTLYFMDLTAFNVFFSPLSMSCKLRTFD